MPVWISCESSEVLSAHHYFDFLQSWMRPVMIMQQLNFMLTKICEKVVNPEITCLTT